MSPHVRRNLRFRQLVSKKVWWSIRFIGVISIPVTIPIMLSQIFNRLLSPSEARSEIRLYFTNKTTYQFLIDSAKVSDDISFKDTKLGEVYFSSLNRLQVENVVVKRPLIVSSRWGGNSNATFARAEIDGIEGYFVISQNHSNFDVSEVSAIRWKIPIW
jgi:hypothetical protein